MTKEFDQNDQVLAWDNSHYACVRCAPVYEHSFARWRPIKSGSVKLPTIKAVLSSIKHCLIFLETIHGAACINKIFFLTSYVFS